MQLPLVTVVIPSYNHQNFVQDSIRSIIQQNYQNIELLVIDDGSSDQSIEKIKEMVEQCEERFVRFEFRYRQNKGLCYTLNEALEWAQGRYFSPFASDDIALPEKISFLVDRIENSNFPAVFGRSADTQGVIKARSLQVEVVHDFTSLIQHKNMPDTPTALISTAAIREVGGYAEDVKLEDWYLWLKLTENGRVLKTYPQVLALYRRHDTNITNNISLLHAERKKVIDKFRHSGFYSVAKDILPLMAARHAERYDKKLALKYLKEYGLFRPRAWPTIIKIFKNRQRAIG